MGKVKKIDFSRKRLSALAEKYYGEGNYLAALRFTYKELEEHGDDVDAFMRLCDVYENLGLHSTALTWWFRCLDCCASEDLPDVYEGLAVNFLNMGKDAQAAYYYNLLIDSDAMIPAETKREIAESFARTPERPMRISYPPEKADFSKEIDLASNALKRGDCKATLKILKNVEKGSADYPAAAEMSALAHLLMGDADKSEEVCKELLADSPNDVRALATLAAAYLEQGRFEESKALAFRLCQEPVTGSEELYKVATVCCENGLHAEAYEKFLLIEQSTPNDGRMLYFKGVAAFNSGKIDEAIQTFDQLCTLYPDAAVVKFHLSAIRQYKKDLEEGKEAQKPEVSYFYQIPKEVRELRCRFLKEIMKASKDEAALIGCLPETREVFSWCFDELDGMDHDLQYLACGVAERCGADWFLQNVLLDPEVLDVLKIEILRMLLERNRDNGFGVVICNIYKEVPLLSLSIGRKKRKAFIAAYARTASKFVPVNAAYATRIKVAAEVLYRAVEKYDLFELMENPDDCACAIYLLSDLKEFGNSPEGAAMAFEANPDRVKALLEVTLKASEED